MRPPRYGWRRRQDLFAFTGAAALALVYALRGSGSYDLVVFEENGLVIWWGLAVGFAVGLLPRGRPSRGGMQLLAALAAYAIWTGASLVWTNSSERSFEELARSLDYLGLVALALCVLDRDSWRSAAAGLGAGAVLVCGIAVGSRLAPSVFGTDTVATGLHIDRLSVPFGYWNSVAAWGAACLALCLAWSVHGSSRARRALAMGVAPVAGLTVYLSYSRAGIVGVGLAALAVLALSRNRLTVLIHVAAAAAGTALAILAVRGAPQVANGTGTGGAATVLGALVVGGGLVASVAAASSGRTDQLRLPRRLLRPVSIASGIIVLVLAGALGPTLVSRGWRSFTRTTAITKGTNPTARLVNLSGYRYPVWKVAIQTFDADPLHGTGAGTFEYSWNRHATVALALRDAHNLWLQNMAELGLPGLLLILGVAICALRLAFGAIRGAGTGTGRGAGTGTGRGAGTGTGRGAAVAFTAATIVYLFHASVDWMWESTAVTVLALAGVAAVGARLSGPRTPLAVPSRAALAVLALAAAAVQLPGVLSTTDIQRSQRAERENEPRLALGWADDSIDAEPWSESAYEQRGLVLEAAGALRAARRDLSAAITRAPDDFNAWLIRSRIETELGEIAAAARDYRRARRLSPRAPIS